MNDFVLALMALLVVVIALGVGAVVVVSRYYPALRLRHRWLRRTVIGAFALLLGCGVVVSIWGTSIDYFIFALTGLLIGVICLALSAFIIFSVYSTALRLRRRWLRRTVVGGFSFLLVCGLVISVWGFIATRQVHREIARISAAGEPITLAAPQTIWAVAPGLAEQDAGSLYAAAIELRRHDRLTEYSPAVGEVGRAVNKGEAASLTDQQRGLLDPLLRANAESLALLDRATAMDRVRPINAERNSFFMINSLGSFRGLANLANIRVTDQLADGRLDDAADSVREVIRAHRALKSDSLISHLVKVAIVSLGAGRATALAHYEGVSAEKLARVDAALGEAEGQLSLADALLGERVLGLALLGIIPGATPSSTASIPQFPWPVNRIAAANYLRFMRDCIEAARQPLPAGIDALRRVEPRMLGGALHPSFVRAAVLVGRSYVAIRAARLAIACELYRRDHGEPPAALADLVPNYIDQVPADPFDGKPLRYKRDGATILIYSVHDDGKDDGGAFFEPVRADPPDWAIRVRLP